MFRLPFLEDSTPPPFYQAKLSDRQRIRLDRWFIGHRSLAYYQKRFAQFDQAGQLHPRWHWAAFFMTFGWLLYRKRYLDCLVYCVAGWSFIKVNIVIILAVAEYTLVGFLPEQLQWYVRIGIALAIWVFWASVVARWADAYYYRVARREIADALDLFEQNEQAQRQHLRKEGGVSLIGLTTALAIFAVLLTIITKQFAPLYIAKAEQQLFFKVYRQTNAVAKQASVLMHQTGQCPTNLPEVIYPHTNIKVVNSVEGIDTSCAVVASVSGVSYPLRYLNGRMLIMYSKPKPEGGTPKNDQQNNGAKWHCQTTLSQKRTPKRCIY